MEIEKTIIRTAKYGIGDIVSLPFANPNDPFYRAQPLKVIEVVPKTDRCPNYFRYFVENHNGEREFFDENQLVLISSGYAQLLEIKEAAILLSEFEVGDKVEWSNHNATRYGNRFGKVVKVVPKENSNKLPYFTYMVEFPSRARHLIKECDLGSA